LEFSNLDVDILQISKEAKKAKSNDPKVINATLGVLLDESGELFRFGAVDEALGDIDIMVARNYLPQDGGVLYKNSLYQYLFKTKLDEFINHFHIGSTWTSGGSGALYIAFKYFKGSHIFVPSIRWNEYDQIAAVAGKTIGSYNLLKNGAFDIENLKNNIIESNEETVMIVVNDPCHNPTGYSMSLSEHETFAQLVNEMSLNKQISVLFDVAYMDYTEYPYFEQLLPVLKMYQPEVDLYIAFSGSKSFGVYGFRMGALLYMNTSENKVDVFEKTVKSFASAIYGAPNSMSVLLLNEVIHKSILDEDQKEARLLINTRANKFMGLCHDEKINFYTYINGFFITVKSKNPLKLTETLKQMGVYVIPTNEGIRIALSSIKLAEIERLVSTLKKAVNISEIY